MSFGVAAIVAGTGAVLGGVIEGSAAQSAANTEAQAADAAAATDMTMFNTENANAQPYIQAGDQALSELNANMSSYNQPFTMNDFENLSPEYAFDLSQGQQAITNSSAAQGGLVSGAELGALNNYSQNEALNAYNSAFSNYQTQIQNSYNRLAGIADLGGQAVSGLNSNTTAMANNLANTTTAAGTASAAGTVGTANAASGAITGLGNSAMTYGLMNTILNNQNPAIGSTISGNGPAVSGYGVSGGAPVGFGEEPAATNDLSSDFMLS